MANFIAYLAEGADSSNRGWVIGDDGSRIGFERVEYFSTECVFSPAYVCGGDGAVEFLDEACGVFARKLLSVGYRPSAVGRLSFHREKFLLGKISQFEEKCRADGKQVRGLTLNKEDVELVRGSPYFAPGTHLSSQGANGSLFKICGYDCFEGAYTRPIKGAPRKLKHLKSRTQDGDTVTVRFDITAPKRKRKKQETSSPIESLLKKFF